MNESKFVLEEVTDPAEIARFRVQDERHRRNQEWLAAHWADLLPHARGRFVAVAGEQAYVANTPEAAWDQARAAHPEDDGAISQYVPRERGPRIYDPTATDQSILGRDVLDIFDVIISRRRNEVLLLAGNHQYQVT